jgi:hypothetical protein
MLNKEICMCSNLRNKNVKYVLTNTILLMPQKNYILQMRNVRLLMINAIVLILVTLTASCSLTAEGQTVGYKRICRTQDVTTEKVRIRILDSRVCPTISSFALFFAPPVW